MGSGVFYRSTRPLLESMGIAIPELRSFDETPTFLQSSREDLRRLRRALKKRVAEKGGPLRVMVMCVSGSPEPSVRSFSKDVISNLRSYLKARGLDRYVTLEQFGWGRPPQQIADRLETIEDAASGQARSRKPEEKVDYIVPLYNDRPSNLVAALERCSEPKPVLLHTTFKDRILDWAIPSRYTQIMQQIADSLRGRKGGN